MGQLKMKFESVNLINTMASKNYSIIHIIQYVSMHVCVKLYNINKGVSARSISVVSSVLIVLPNESTAATPMMSAVGKLSATS